MKHVLIEFTSPTSYKMTVDGVVTSYKCELVVIPHGKKEDVINPAHNEAWSRMLEAFNADESSSR